MAVIDLTGIPVASAMPMVVDMGGVVGAASGGASSRVNRLGTRWAWRFETAPMPAGGVGAYWSGMLAQARYAGARLKVSQPGFAIGAPGSPVVSAATASGRNVPVSGLTPGYQVRRGQWLSLERAAGDRYLDINLNDVIAAGDGTATLLIANLLRAPLASGDVVNLAAPAIEGWLTDFESWEMGRNRLVTFGFTIAEAA